MKKCIAWILMLVMLLPVIVSCKSKNDEQNRTDDSSSVSTETNAPPGEEFEYDENGYRKDRLGKMDFGGKQINISAWSEAQSATIPEFFVTSDEMGTDTVKTAVYMRNIMVENRMKVKLNFELTPGWMGGGVHEQTTRIRMAAGTNEIDIVASYSWLPATLMMEGLVVDLKQFEQLDLTAPWWNSKMIDTCSVYDSLFFCTGDISMQFYGNTVAIFFNKEIAEQNQVEDLYALVDSGKWTLDKMMTISKAVGKNNDNGDDLDDLYGYTVSDVYFDQLYQASGMVTVSNASDGSLILSDDFGSSKAQELLSRMIDFANHPSTMCSMEKKTNASHWSNVWSDGNALFCQMTFEQAREYAQSMNNFGLLPLPKYDDGQEEYRTSSGFYYTIYSIMRDAANTPAVSATLECLASESYRGTIPAYYDKILVNRTSHSNEEKIMWNYIRESQIVDPGRVYSTQLKSYTWNPYRTAYREGNSGWMSVYANISPTMMTALDSINTLVYAMKSLYS
ncbi:MAG: hypothetical protein ACI3XQ_05340 [Eubacteriales bacterium]